MTETAQLNKQNSSGISQQRHFVNNSLVTSFLLSLGEHFLCPELGTHSVVDEDLQYVLLRKLSPKH